MRQRSDRTESCSDTRQSHTTHSRCGLVVQTCARQRRLGRVLGGIRTGHIKDERVYSIDRLAVNCPPSSNDRRGGEVESAGQCVVLGCEQKGARTPAYLLCPGPLDVLRQPLQPLKQALACRCATIPVSAFYHIQDPLQLCPLVCCVPEMRRDATASRYWDGAE
jgi:hypothetical protein